MNKSKISIIGGGHIGSAMSDRATAQGVEHHISQDRDHNAELVEGADLIVLAVRPNQISTVANQTRDVIGRTATILSFASAPSCRSIAEMFGVKVFRAMSDIGMEQVLCMEGTGLAQEFCEKISINKLIVGGEQDIDAFTVYVGCLPGVATWQFAHKSTVAAAKAWLDNYADHIAEQIGVPQSVTHRIIRGVEETEGRDYISNIARVATPGGVTESMIKALELDNGISFDALSLVGLNQLKKISDQIK